MRWIGVCLGLLLTACNQSDAPTQTDAPVAIADPAVVMPTPLEPQAVPSTSFRIRSVNAEGACVQAVNDANPDPYLAASLNNLAIDYCARPSPQTFSFLPSRLDPSVGSLTVYGGAFCLDVGASPFNGSNVLTWPCIDSPSQQFTVTAANEIRDFSGRCMTLEGSNLAFYSTNPGGSARLRLRPCVDTVDQKWNLDAGPHSYAAATLSVDQSQTSRICQLVGEFDRKTGVANSNRSESRYGIPGADLGSPVWHHDKLFFIFGDTFFNTNPALYNTTSGLRYANRSGDSDSIAYTTSADPDACLALTWNADSDGLFKPITVPGEHLGGTEVPSGGFSVDGTLYVLFATDNQGGSIGGMTKSFLAKSLDDGMTYSKLYDVSKDPRAFGAFNAGRFINGAADVVSTADVPGLPANGKAVVLFGSGAFRRSNPYLAVIPGESVEAAGALRYFAGVDLDNRPRWSVNEYAAQPLFETVSLGQNIGEISAAYDPAMGKWVMMYTGFFEYPARVLLRIADHPWGPWSPPVTVFDPVNNNAYGNFMHGVSGSCFDGTGIPLDSLQDYRVDPVPTMCGIVYAPSFIKRYTKALGHGRFQIYFDMSTWVPYAVHLMTATVTVQ